MAVAIVNTSAKFQVVNGGDVSGQALGFTPTVGNHLFLLIASYTQGGGSGTVGINAVTSTGNSWAQDADAEALAGAVCTAEIFSCKVAQATTTVNVDFVTNSGIYAEYCVVEVSGLDATTHKDKTGTNSSINNNDDATVTASGQNATADGIAFAVCSVSNDDVDINIGDVPPTGYTASQVNENGNGTIGFWSGYKIYSSLETSAATWAHDNDNQSGWAASVVTYKMGAGGASPNLPRNVVGAELLRPFNMTARFRR